MTAASVRVSQDQSFAAIAVELHLAKHSLGELSFAAAILSMMRTDRLETITRVSKKCGIESGVIEKIMLDEQRFTSLIAEAHRLFKAMIPHESAIRAILGSENDA